MHFSIVIQTLYDNYGNGQDNEANGFYDGDIDRLPSQSVLQFQS